MTEQQSFGLLLRRYRRAAGLTQEELAERAGISTDAVSALERGTRQRPYRDTIDLLATALGLDPADRAVLARAGRSRAHEATAAAPSVRLPRTLTSLIGREGETGEVLALMVEAGERLLTLTGPGGVGKTRLALHVAERSAPHFPDGVTFVELAPLRDPELAAPTIAHAVGVGEQVQTVEELTTFLGERRHLLVLDNFEHLLAAAGLVAHLLTSCPRLQILVTSRAVLHLQGERVYAVPPLATPEPGVAPMPDDLYRIPATALLLKRAHAAMPEFEVTTRNAGDIAQLCRHLDGLPLALELAAARLTVLSPHLLLQRLTHRLPLLTGGARDLPERQRTLHATLSWSYALLTPGEQQLFSQLSVAVGGCTLEAAEALSGEPESTAEPVVDRLAALVDKSLVRRERWGDELRFSMLEMVREYGLEQLEAGGDAEGTRRAHARYFHRLACAAEQELIGPAQAEWLERLERDHGNIRAALDWLQQANQGSDALDMAASLWRFWATRGYVVEGRARLEDALRQAEEEAVSPGVVARAAFAAGAMAFHQADLAGATTYWERALALFRDSGDRTGTATTLNGLGLAHTEAGAYAPATACLEESIMLHREEGNRTSMAKPLHNLANVLRYQGEYARALALYEEALELEGSEGSRQSRATTMDNLAQTAEEMGDYDRAEALGNECLALMRELGDRSGSAHALVTLGCVALDRGDLPQAKGRFESALDLYRSVGAEALEVFPLQNLASIALQEGNSVSAQSLAQRALAISTEYGDTRARAYVLLTLGDVAMQAGNVAHAASLYEEAHEINTGLGAALGIAESNERRAHAALAQGRAMEARALYRKAAEQRRRMGAPLPVRDGRRMEADMTLLGER